MGRLDQARVRDAARVGRRRLWAGVPAARRVGPFRGRGGLRRAPIVIKTANKLSERRGAGTEP